MDDRFFKYWFTFVGSLAIAMLAFLGWVVVQLLQHFGVV